MQPSLQPADQHKKDAALFSFVPAPDGCGIFFVCAKPVLMYNNIIKSRADCPAHTRRIQRLFIKTSGYRTERTELTEHTGSFCRHIISTSGYSRKQHGQERMFF